MFRTLLPTLEPSPLLDRWFDEASRPWSMLAARRLEVRESADEYRVRCEVPGLEPEQLELELAHDLLTIRTRTEHERAARTVRLGLPIQSDQVQAELKNGVLTVTLPKLEAVRPRRIEVRSASTASATQQLEARGAEAPASTSAAAAATGAE